VSLVKGKAPLIVLSLIAILAFASIERGSSQRELDFCGMGVEEWFQKLRDGNVGCNPGPNPRAVEAFLMFGTNALPFLRTKISPSPGFRLNCPLSRL
jgi:hypothetical protein